MHKRLTGIRTGLFLRLAEGEPAGGEPAGGGSGGGGTAPPEFQPITTQADLDKLIGDRVRRDRTARQPEYDDLKRKADAFDAAEAEKQSDVDKANTRATTAEARAKTAEDELLRFQVAVAKGMPAALAGRLQGTTREELEADADALLALVPGGGAPAGGASGSGGTPPRPRPDSTQGSSTPARDTGSEARRAQMYRALGRPVPSA